MRASRSLAFGFGAIALVALLVAACDGAGPSTAEVGVRAPLGSSPPDDPAVELASLVQQKKLIRTGRMTLEVDSLGAAVDRAGAIAASSGGFVSGARIDGGDASEREAVLTVRVPAARFDETRAALATLGQVGETSFDTEEVTDKYFDLETRLRVARSSEARLHQLLASRTGDLKDVLQVERELARIVGEIEQLLGQQRYLERQVALSTLVVVLQEPGGEVVGIPETFRGALTDSLELMAASLRTLVLALALSLPWMVLATLGWGVWTVVRRFRSPVTP